MGNLASGHFKPTNKIQAEHNDRTLSPNYLIPEEFRGQNEVNRPSTQARGLRDKIIENAHQTYLITFKQKSQAKSYQWSLVVNIKNNTTMSDLEKLAEHFEVKYGFQCYQIAIHRDEGYMDENNQPHINHHAHMEFITLKKENGKNMWGQINQVKLRQIQTEIAQILGMERGTDKRVSGTERIEPRKYAQMKNQERKELESKEKELNTLKQDKTNLEKNSSNLALELEKAKDRIETLESNETTLKNDLNAKDKTINELKKQIQDLEYNYKQERERMQAENKHLKDQGLEKIYTQKDYEALKKQHADEIEALKKEIQEQDKYKTKSNALRYQQVKQRKAMKIKQTTTPTPSPTPQPTYTYTKRI
ncbi:mobilization protein [Helicobacter pylori]